MCCLATPVPGLVPAPFRPLLTFSVKGAAFRTWPHKGSSPSILGWDSWAFALLDFMPPLPLPQHCSKSCNQQHFGWEPGGTSCDRTVSPRKEGVGVPCIQLPASREPRLWKLLPIPSLALTTPRLSGRGHQANGMSKHRFSDSPD